MPSSEREGWFSDVWITAAGTLSSRVLGLLRDMATAALLGLSAGGAMDAFVIAFRIPNLFRRLFGEGALSASYLPVLTAELETSRQAAWRFTSVVLVWLTVLLIVLVLAGELACAALWYFYHDAPGVPLLAGLTAAMLPYVVFVCLAAQLSGTLNALSHFSLPAITPAILNVFWLAAAWGIAPFFAESKEQQAFVLAAAIVVAGVVQTAVLAGRLRRFGFRFDYNWSASRAAVFETVRGAAPAALGLAATQVNTLVDSLIAWGLTAPPGGASGGAWLGGGLDYPLRQGAAAAIYFGERFYQFPVGMLGLAVATVIFPLLSRHAARGEHGRVAADLTLGMRLVLFYSLPAAAGLVLLGEPIARLLLERGEVTADDAARAGLMIACYGAGAWAYCGLPVMIRGFYALGDRATPVLAGAAVVVLNGLLDAFLVWPLAEAGLALGTALAAGLQLLMLMFLFSRRAQPLGAAALLRTTAKAAVATVLMSAAILLLSPALPDAGDLASRATRVAAPLALGAVVFLAIARLLGSDELKLFSRPRNYGRF